MRDNNLSIKEAASLQTIYEKKILLTNEVLNQGKIDKSLINKYFLSIDDDNNDNDITIIKKTFNMYNYLEISDIFELDDNLLNNNLYHSKGAPYPSKYDPKLGGYWVAMSGGPNEYRETHNCCVI